ncbi:MAG TPA: universal stress protein, partial [Phaeodactylibacter sp.]|nr:universal stress protein [Phaeodactylibacter sp.]
DFSENSIKALRTAIALNESLSEPAKITVLNVYEMPNLSVYKIQRTREQFERMLQKDHEEAMNAFLNTQVPDYRDQLETKLIMQKTPGIAQYIMDVAEEYEGDFIVMGAKGHSKVELLLLGSVTEKLLGLNEHIPTLIVK